MFKFFLKLVLPVTVIGAGGTAIGIPLSNSLNQSNSSDQIHSPSLPALEPLKDQQETQVPEVHSTTESTVQTGLSATAREGLSQLPTVEDRVTRHESAQTLMESSNIAQTEGNCTVIKPSLGKVQVLLPSSYLSVYCESDVDEYSLLKRWKGFFPSTLLKEEVENFKEGTKLQVDVKEIDLLSSETEQDEEDLEPYETIFTSKKFLNDSFTGKWGYTRLNDEEDDMDDLSIYVVNLKKSKLSENFYISPQ